MPFLLGSTLASLVALAVGLGVDRDSKPAYLGPEMAWESMPGGDIAVMLPRILDATPEAIAGSDIARLNLACAVGLPGAQQLDVAGTIAELDRWAEHVKAETERNFHRFRAQPGEFQNSEAYFRALMLIVALQGDLGVHYNPARISEPDFTNSKDLFLHGMVADANGGTCVSMPVLYVAIGRRLGYPMRLTLTKGHVFARWDGAERANPAFRGRFNVEGTNRGLSTFDDAHYAEWPNKLTDAERANDWFLRSLDPAEELAVFLMQRGHCLEDTGRTAEAQVAYAMAHKLAPKSPEALAYLVNVVRGEAIARASSDPQAVAGNAKRDSSAQWTAEGRRQATEIARQAIERGRIQPTTAPSSPRPPPGGPIAPQIPGMPK